jgi:hypothetical protein
MSDLDLIYGTKPTIPSSPAEAEKKEETLTSKKISTKPIKKESKHASKQAKQSQSDEGVRTYVRTDGTSVRTDNLLDLIPPTPDKRRPERYAFQFWEDQITKLKQLRKVMNLSKDAAAREEVSLSDMIREAVDDYIEKQIKRLKQSVRTDE